MQLFLFGSALHSATPRDIDILVVYPAALDAHDALRFRSKLVTKLKKYSSILVHVVLLSDREEHQVEFVRNENCRPLTRKDIRRLAVLGPPITLP